jgi:hypothetical protein
MTEAIQKRTGSQSDVVGRGRDGEDLVKTEGEEGVMDIAYAVSGKLAVQ